MFVLPKLRNYLRCPKVCSSSFYIYRPCVMGIAEGIYHATKDTYEVLSFSTIKFLVYTVDIFYKVSIKNWYVFIISEFRG
jgi:hypothetical protein